MGRQLILQLVIRVFVILLGTTFAWGIALLVGRVAFSWERVTFFVIAGAWAFAGINGIIHEIQYARRGYPPKDPSAF